MNQVRFHNLTLASTVHNNAEMSKEMVDSFLQRVGVPAEVILVDDASLLPVKASDYDTSVRIIRSDTGLGFCGASDRALREVRTDFAVLVDADVIFLAGDFAGGYAAFCDDVNAAWCVFAQVNSAGLRTGSYFSRLPPAWLFGLGNQATALWMRFADAESASTTQGRLVRVGAAHSSSTLVRLAAFRQINGFDRWYWQCESDIDLSLRFIRHGYTVAIDPGYTVCHEGVGGKTGGPKRIIDLYRAKLHLYETFDPDCRSYLRWLLWCRHLLEALYFTLSKLGFDNGAGAKLSLRMTMLRTVFNGYAGETKCTTPHPT